MRVLLLNPPGRELYVRDYFCSKTTKSNYNFHPVDLLALSGTVAAEHDVSVLDCIAQGVNIGLGAVPDETIQTNETEEAK